MGSVLGTILKYSALMVGGVFAARQVGNWLDTAGAAVKEYAESIVNPSSTAPLIKAAKIESAKNDAFWDAAEQKNKDAAAQIAEMNKYLDSLPGGPK